jgi:hypothetical protein
MLVDRIGGKRMLRLDYGYNIKTKTIDFHWNQKGVAESFGISNHTPAGQMGEAIYKGARYFKWGGRVLLVAAAIADGYSVVTSDRPWRQLAIVTGGWTGAWAGCKAFGAIGAAIGTAAEPGGGTAIGGAVGCFAGSLGGYWEGRRWSQWQLITKQPRTWGAPSRSCWHRHQATWTCPLRTTPAGTRRQSVVRA